MAGREAREITIDVTPFTGMQKHEKFFLLEFVSAARRNGVSG